MSSKILDIVQAGAPVLRQQAQALSPAEIRSAPLQTLIEQMRETMRRAPGVGLAAPQVGLGLQLAVIEDHAEYQQNLSEAQRRERGRQPIPFQVLINPRLTMLQGAPVTFFEGCLSVAGFMAMVPRAAAVQVDALNERGEAVRIQAEGWYARILQHEIDHLQGRLYLDIMLSRSFMGIDNYARHWQGLSLAEVCQALQIDCPELAHSHT